MASHTDDSKRIVNIGGPVDEHPRHSTVQVRHVRYRILKIIAMVLVAVLVFAGSVAAATWLNINNAVQSGKIRSLIEGESDEDAYLDPNSGKPINFVLIGQDTGIWGRDLDGAGEGPRDLAGLLRAVAEAVRPHKVWVRVLYLQPEGMTDDLIAAIRDTPEVLPYIDIPVQHCSSRVLAAMNRSGSERELEELFDRLRREIPGMVIRTTYLVGFPGETDGEHEAMLAFMDRIGFDYTSVFSFSPEEGTRAVLLDGQIDDETKRERTQTAVDLAEALGFAATAARVGQTAEVIVDGIEETDEGYELIGHAWFQAPDSDGAVHLDAEEAAVGDVLTVEFTDSFCYELVGRVVKE